jgi:hypothetical protein
MVNELWSYHVLPIGGLCAYPRFSPMLKTLQRQRHDQEYHLLGPIPLHGLCLVDLPGKSERHPGLSTSSTYQAVSSGLPGKGLKKHPGQRHPSAGLEDMRPLHNPPFFKCRSGSDLS